MADDNRVFHGLVLITFGLMAVVILLSAYMRLTGAGLSCSDWPTCYGRNLSGLAPPHPNWVNITHRIAASAMGFTTLAIAAFAWRRRRMAPPGDFLPALGLFGLMAFLAVLGKWTHDARLPAVALGNLLGGLGMLALLWRLHLGCAFQYTASSRLRRWVLVGLWLLTAQIALGGMVSASFAALSCGPIGCDGWLQNASPADFNPFQMLMVPQGGNFIAGEVQQTLHMTHRFFALLVFCYLVWLGVHLIRENLRRSGMLLIAALTSQIALGISAVAYGLPLFLVLTHNAMAAFLLLILVTLNFRLNRR